MLAPALARLADRFAGAADVREMVERLPAELHAHVYARAGELTRMLHGHHGPAAGLGDGARRRIWADTLLRNDVSLVRALPTPARAEPPFGHGGSGGYDGRGESSGAGLGWEQLFVHTYEMQRALSGVLAHASIVGHGLLLITPARRIARIAPAAVACGVQDAWAAPRLLGLALRMRAGDGHPRVEHADAVVAAVAAGMGLAPLVWSVTCISPASPHSTLPMPALPASASARVPRVEVMPQRTARTEMPMCYALAALELAVECGHIHIARHLAPKAYPLRPRIATAVRSSNSDMLRFVAGLHPRHIVFDGGELEQCVALGRNTQIIWLVEHTNWVFDSRGDGVASVDAGAAGASLALGNEDGAGGSAEQASVAGAQLVREMQIMCARHGNVELLAYMAQIEPVCVLAVEVAVASGCQPVLSWLREHLGVCAPSAQCSE